MQGLISSVGQHIAFRDFNVVIPAQNGGVSAWTADQTIGGNAYKQTVLTADISAGLYIDGNTRFDVLPALRSGATVLTESDLDIFDDISYAESTATGIQFVSVTRQPTADIPVTIRIYKQ